MEQLPKVIGKIDLEEIESRYSHKFLQRLSEIDCCADCHAPFRDNHDRVKITTKYRNGTEDIREVCEQCSSDMFDDHEPNSIFD